MGHPAGFPWCGLEVSVAVLCAWSLPYPAAVVGVFDLALESG